MESATSSLRNKLSRNVSCADCIKVLSPSSQRPSGSGENRQYDSGLLYKSSVGPEVTPFMHTGASGSFLGPGEVSVALSDVYPWSPECRSRNPVNMGVETLGMEADLGEIRSSGSRPIHIPRDNPLPVMVFFDSSSHIELGYRHGRGDACMLFRRLLCFQEC